MKLKNEIGLQAQHTFIFRDARTGEILHKKTYKNAICNVCKTMIAARLAGGSANTDITYGAVGTGAFPATPATSTTLVTELARAALTAISSTGAVITATTYFGAADANGTLTEFGLFGNGATAAADSGTMINHAQISETKSSAETLTIESTITIT